MSVLEQDIALTSVDASGNQIIYYPVTIADNVTGAVKTVNNNAPDANGNVNIEAGSGGNLEALTARVEALENYKRNTVGSIRTRDENKYNYGQV